MQDADDDNAMEDRFLRARQERDQAMKANRQGVSDDTSDRQNFYQEVARLQRSIEEKLQSPESGAGSDSASIVDAAMHDWREMQALLQTATETLRLPPRDTQTANQTLQRLLGAIEARRQAAKPARRFAFSKTTKTTTVANGETKPAAPTEPTPSSSTTQSVGQQTAAVASAVAEPAAQYTGDRGHTFYHKTATDIFVPPGDAVFIRHCVGCTVWTLPIAGSVFLSDCRDCTVYVACHQLRIKACESCVLYVACNSTPVIEGSRNMRFGGYEAWHGLLRSALPTGSTTQHCATHEEWTRVVGAMGEWARVSKSFQHVDDFDWLRQQKSPNWEVVALGDWKVSDRVFEL